MKVAETAGLINQLTTDNDERQELWLHYIQNSDISALTAYLSKIRKTFSEDQLLQITLWRKVNCSSERDLLELFDHFTDLEQSIMHLLALGATLEEISGIKSIKVARIRHIVSVIREHEVWQKYGNT